MKVFANKFGQVVEKSFEFVLCLISFAKATQFRYSSEYSDCVHVWAKSCLPCQILYVKQFVLFLQRVEKPRYESSAIVLRKLVSSSFLCSKDA